MVYTLAVIGCGVIGQRLGTAFNQHDQVELRYAVDLDRERLDQYCEQFECQGFTDYKEVLTRDDVDIIYIGIPPKYHFQITMDALDSGKHVICEKPIAVSADLGEQMAARARETGKVTAINFVFRYSPTFAHLKRIITEGKLGEITNIEIKIRMPRWPRAWQDVAWLKDHDQGGPLREIGSHFIFGVQEIFGSLNVTSSQVDFTAPGKYEKEIQASFTTRGIAGQLDLITDNEEPEENTLYITGTGGKLRFRGWYILEQLDETIGEWKLVDDQTKNLSLELTSAVVAAIEGDGDLVSFEEATSVQAVVDAIFSKSS